jgi:hypothetical protein
MPLPVVQLGQEQLPVSRVFAAPHGVDESGPGYYFCLPTCGGCVCGPFPSAAQARQLRRRVARLSVAARRAWVLGDLRL